jgi:potassium-dependent mechanosensitive channel
MHRMALLPGLLLLALLSLPPAAAVSQDSVPAAANGQGTEQLAARRQALEDDRLAIERTREELRALREDMPRLLSELQVGHLTELMVEQARVDADSARLRREDLQVDIHNTERRIKELEQTIRALEVSQQGLRGPAPAEADPALRRGQLERIGLSLPLRSAELALEREHLENLYARSELADLRLTLTGQYLNRVEEIYRLQLEQTRREAQEDLVQRMQREQQTHLERAAALTQRLDRERADLSPAEARLIEITVQSAEEQAKLIQLDMRLMEVGEELAKVEEAATAPETAPKLLLEGLEQLTDLRMELLSTEALLQRKLGLLEQQQRVVERRQAADGEAAPWSSRKIVHLQELHQETEQRRVRVVGMAAEVEQLHARLEASYNATLRKNMLDRRPLPTGLEEWQQVVVDLVNAPTALLYQVQQSLESTLARPEGSAPLRWAVLAVAVLVLLWIAYVTRRVVAHATDSLAEVSDTFTSNFSLVLLLVLRKNLMGAALAAGVLGAAWLLEVPQPGLGIIITAVLVWIGIKVPVDLAWLLLASPRVPEPQRRPRLYLQLAWSLLLGGLLAATTILAHLGSLPDTIIDTVDRVFMAYLLLMFVPALWVRRFLLDLMAQRYGERSWFFSLRMISLLVPLSLLSAAALGLAGYLNLAWAVAWHLLMFVLALVGWLVARGMLNDLAKALKNFAVTHSGYGLLWTQEVIAPLHKILNVALFIGAWALLLRAYGWYGETAIVTTVVSLLERPLFSVGSTDISLAAVITTALVFAVVFWLGQWVRAVTYRWVYSGIVDQGARHSLSVFTQYAVVLIGVLIMLNMLGVNLTTLTVFAGALGVGIGFGLQNIANNFVSGLLLLIERPLRSGDVVQIGTNEGEISHIGIRSLSLKTFDNQEVIIPNSDVIANSFTNWTHNDDIVRTVLLIGASYKADPHRVKPLLEEIIRTHPAVLREPEPAVLLWDFADSAITYRLHYYTHLRSSSRLGVRSEIMLSIWDAFRREGVDIPFPHRELFVREWPKAEADALGPLEPATVPEFAEGDAPGRRTGTRSGYT